MFSPKMQSVVDAEATTTPEPPKNSKRKRIATCCCKIEGKTHRFCRVHIGSGICEHDRRKSKCKYCGGSEICEHERQRSQCKDCGGSGICEHDMRKSQCKYCDGSEICEHNKIRRVCKDCGGSGICVHDREKYTCKDCGGGEICVHGIRRSTCKACGGSQICKHKKQKQHCKSCGGSGLCKTDGCETTAQCKKFEGHCGRCFAFTHPDTEFARNHKTKENDVVDRIKSEFEGLTWVADRRVQGGSSGRRPDLLLDFGLHVLIVEVDEYKHVLYDRESEDKRVEEISQDLNHRPAVFIRFNPDAYTDQHGKHVSFCWK